jgi:cytochrome c
MYTLENIKLNRVLLAVGVSALFASSSFAIEKSVDGAVKYKVKNGKYTQYHINTQKHEKFNIGRKPTKTEVRAWDVDVMPDGTGLPEFDMKHGKVVMENGKPKKAEGSVAWGNKLYDEQCVMCHGEFGAGGVGGYPALSGGEHESLSNQLMDPADDNPGIEPPRKTIGTYWPYASTLYWYIQDAMPYPASKTLSNSETYALTAYLLYENGITVGGEEIDEDFVLSKENFMKIEMRNTDGFYPVVDTPKNPKKGVENMKKFLSNPKNYGTGGKRCMKDCIKGKLPLLRIKHELDEIYPAPSTVRDLPKKKAQSGIDAHPGKEGYEAKCSACHANAAIGAPVVGDKAAWAAVMEKGKDKVYHNGINGINTMPPKGGHMDLSDDQVKEIIDYMIEASK